MGLIPNALPRHYLAEPRSGEWWIMRDGSKNPDGATGPQVCLAVIPMATVEQLVASKQPVRLRPEETEL